MTTNPAVTNATVIKPYLQLQGYVNEPLVALTYDLTNAAGLLTNEMAAVVDQHFDTNAFDFTTNYFQAYDVALTNGLNQITLTVSDRAGNVTVTNIAVTLDYTTATNPPVMQLLWPTNGMHLSGESFYLRGLINDETASVLAQWVDGNGVTNEIPGLVERNQVFWVEGLPLASGTNEFTLIATDAAGNLSRTNLSVSKSSVTLTITSTPEGESLYTPRGTVNGTVSDPSYAVSVNGVAATVDEYGNWMAENVPVVGQGTATFDAVATGGSGSTPAATSSPPEMPSFVAIVKHTTSKSTTANDGDGNFSSYGRGKGYTADVQAGEQGNWRTSFHGTAVDLYEDNFGWSKLSYDWKPEHRTTDYEDSTGFEMSEDTIDEDCYGSVTHIPDRDVAELGWLGGMGGEGAYPPKFIEHYFAKGVNYEWPYGDGGKATASVEAKTQVKLFTGGKAGVNRKSLFEISASAATYGRAPDQPWLHTPITPIVATAVKVMGKALGSDGRSWLALPDNSEQDLTVTVAAKHYGANAAAAKYKPFISANGSNLYNTAPEFCVGQLVTFSLAFEPGVDYVDLIGQWKIPDKFVNESYQYSSTCISYRKNADLLVNTNSTACWFVNGNGGDVSLGANLRFANGQMVSLAAMGKIDVYRPTFSDFDCWMNTFTYSTPTLYADMRWSVTVNSKYSGSIGITQLINGSAPFYATGGEWYQDGETELYVSQPYNVSHIVTLWDNPSAPTFGYLHMKADFKDYLRFQPGTPGSIWVTLGTNGWSMDGVDGSSVLPAASPVVDSDEFPLWQGIRHE